MGVTYMYLKMGGIELSSVPADGIYPCQGLGMEIWRDVEVRVVVMGWFGFVRESW